MTQTTTTSSLSAVVLALDVTEAGGAAGRVQELVGQRATDGWTWTGDLREAHAHVVVAVTGAGWSVCIRASQEHAVEAPAALPAAPLPAGGDVIGVAAVVHALACAYVACRRAQHGERARDELLVRVERQQQALRLAMQERGAGVLRALEDERRVEIEHTTLASHDAGTGLVRHGRFRERLQFEIARSTRTGEGLGLLLLDVDGMSRINDVHGYDAGDELLQRIARSLVSLWVGNEGGRPPVLGRDVGDCFAIILPGTTTERALRDGERVRALVHRLPLGSLRTTVSVGVAMWTPPTTARALLDAAQDAVNEARRRGGNRCAYRTDDP